MFVKSLWGQVPLLGKCSSFSPICWTHVMFWRAAHRRLRYGYTVAAVPAAGAISSCGDGDVDIVCQIFRWGCRCRSKDDRPKMNRQLRRVNLKYRFHQGDHLRTAALVKFTKESDCRRCYFVQEKGEALLLKRRHYGRVVTHLSALTTVLVGKSFHSQHKKKDPAAVAASIVVGRWASAPRLPLLYDLSFVTSPEGAARKFLHGWRPPFLPAHTYNNVLLGHIWRKQIKEIN